MHVITIRGKTFEGETLADTVVDAFKDELKPSQAEIAAASGVTRQRVYTILQQVGLGGSREYPELDDPETFENRTDAEIAWRLGVAESTVTKARWELTRQGHDLRKPHSVNVSNRRAHLVKKLFDNGYTPGPKFAEWVEAVAAEHLNDPAAVVDFYVKGMTDGLARNDSRMRFNRFNKVQKLKARLNVDPKELVKAEVLCA